MPDNGGSNVSEQANASPFPAWFGNVPGAEAVRLQKHLSPYVESLRSKAVAACPGRTADLIRCCTRSLLGLPGETLDYASLEPAERLVVDIAEQFVLDVHSVTDEQFAALREHYETPDILAMLFEMALNDGFNKMEKVSLDTDKMNTVSLDTGH